MPVRLKCYACPLVPAGGGGPSGSGLLGGTERSGVDLTIPSSSGNKGHVLHYLLSLACTLCSKAYIICIGHVPGVVAPAHCAVKHISYVSDMFREL